jgi:hypothetical protein
VSGFDTLALARSLRGPLTGGGGGLS